MLGLFVIRFEFFRFVQSGLYIDFLAKQASEIFVRNFFIYTPLFFGEKFLIEYVTKKTVDSFLFNFNRIFNYLDLDYSYFFIQIISIHIYVLTFINLLYFLL